MSEETLYVRFICASTEHPKAMDIPVPAGPTVLANLQWFVTSHVHAEGDSMRMDSDRRALYTVLEKFFAEELPRISEILVRRKLTFALEIRYAGRAGEV